MEGVRNQGSQYQPVQTTEGGSGTNNQSQDRASQLTAGNRPGYNLGQALQDFGDGAMTAGAAGLITGIVTGNAEVGIVGASTGAAGAAVKAVGVMRQASENRARPQRQPEP